MRISKSRTVFLLSLIAAVGTGAPVSAASDGGDKPTRVYWGDTHVHTSNSFDVYFFNTPGSTPETAFRFAKGLPVVSPVTGTRWQLKTPLDFLVVSDHANQGRQRSASAAVAYGRVRGL